jgi:hypothetical protein
MVDVFILLLLSDLQRLENIISSIIVLGFSYHLVNVITYGLAQWCPTFFSNGQKVWAKSDGGQKNSLPISHYGTINCVL